jgi:hypothetical protein
MADQDLSAASSSGTQSATQDPQTSTSGQLGGTTSSSVQPGSSVNLFSGQSGVSLNPTSLSTVNLNSDSSATTTTTVASPAVLKHNPNTVLLGLMVILVVLAIAIFWKFTSSAKNTTLYS